MKFFACSAFNIYLSGDINFNNRIPILKENNFLIFVMFNVFSVFELINQYFKLS